MTRWLPRATIAVLAVVTTLLVFETKRLAEQVGTFEREAHEQRARADALAQAAAAAEVDGRQSPPTPADGANPPDPAPEPGPALAEFTRVKLELHTTREQLAAVTALLEQRNAELQRRAEEAEQRARELLRPMPEGVRLCLQALHDCLREEGFAQQRFLRAATLDDEGLHDVELLDAAADGLGVAFVQAARMTATLDRAAGRLELRFYDGTRTAGDERAALSEDGLPMVFEDVDGRMFEARLPFLVRGEGAYPVELPSAARPATDLDIGSRRQWLARIERVLAMAKTEVRWRPTRLRGLHDGAFLTVDLVGTDDRNHVVESAHCGRAQFEVDEKRGVVSLWMHGGVLRRGGLESTIGSEGYRMLLPGLTPSQVTDAMFGMVSKR